MKLLYLSDGSPVKVDDADYDWLSQYVWTRSAKYYARSAKLKQYMHRLLMDAPKGMVVDHINGDPLDNRRSNLRICTQRDNTRNSKGTGTSLDKRRGTWRAEITVNRKRYYVGTGFKTQEDAMRAYDKAARRHFGEYAKLNFPNEQEGQ